MATSEQQDADWTAKRSAPDWEIVDARTVADWGAEYALADWTIPTRDVPTD